jgi:hypothetical protein
LIAVRITVKQGPNGPPARRKGSLGSGAVAASLPPSWPGLAWPGLAAILPCRCLHCSAKSLTPVNLMLVPLNRDAIRNRIKERITVQVRDLVPHERNSSKFPPAQRSILQEQLGDRDSAQSLLGYRLSSGGIKLIDGNLQASLDPKQEVTVEVLDVSEDEARNLLLSIDFAWLDSRLPEEPDNSNPMDQTRSDSLDKLHCSPEQSHS